jgi:putative membrane protein
VVSEPDLRFLQANERTLLAWVRTGLALMAFGFVISRLALWLELEIHRADAFSLGLGASIVAAGAACQVLGAIRYVRARSALIEGRAITPGAAGPVAVALVVGAVGVALCIYLLAG